MMQLKICSVFETDTYILACQAFNFKRRVSSHFVAKTTTCCICMWKLSFLKYGNTHLISELYYKIGRRFIFRKIIMFSVPLGSSSRAVSPIFEK